MLVGWLLQSKSWRSIGASAFIEHVFLRKGTAKSKKVSIHAGLWRLALKSSRRENRRNNKKRQIEHLRFGRMQLKTVFSLFSSPFPKQIEFRKDVKP